jgi:hypothetical protein
MCRRPAMLQRFPVRSEGTKEQPKGGTCGANCWKPLPREVGRSSGPLTDEHDMRRHGEPLPFISLVGDVRRVFTGQGLHVDVA